MSEFKELHSFEKRLQESSRIISKYTERIPVIVEPIGKNKLVLDKKKYLVPSDMTMGQFIYVIRKRLKIEASKALFLFVCNKNNTTVLVNGAQLLADIYVQHKDEDKFLYVKFSEENSFGAEK